MATVKTPERWLSFFDRAEDLVRAYFANKEELPERGRIAVGDERYVLVRAEALSVEFYGMMRELYGGNAEEGDAVARNLLFHIAHFFGRADARNFHRRLGLEDPIAKLSAGPVHFAHTGWASVEILADSHPVPNEDFLLIYDHPYSFEAESWREAGREVPFPICFMNAGYSSGWCEESFGVPLVAVEVTCIAKGDPFCRFIMGHPSRIDAHVREYLREYPDVAACVSTYEVPGEFLRKSVDDRLRLTENRYRLLFENARDAIFVVQDGFVEHVNPSALALLGTTPLRVQGQRLESLAPAQQPDGRKSGDVLQRRASRALDGSPQLFAWRFNARDGTPIDTELSLNAMPDRGGSMLVIARDISERLRVERERIRLEREVRQLQKMEALGTLAGGIAHDFNNLLTGIGCNLDLIGREVPESSSYASEAIVDAKAVVKRAAGLVKQLLTFARTSQGLSELVDLNDVVRDVNVMIRETVDRRIQLEMELSQAAPVIADPNQVSQVVVNLAVNARDAVLERLRDESAPVAPCIRFITRDVQRAAPAGSDTGGAESRTWVQLMVSDTGIGMGSETQARAMEPFFTTKPVGSGSGLGLTIVYGIAKRHGGWVEIVSAKSEGATVSVFLPAAHGSERSAGTGIQAPRTLVGTETILFIDDEVMLLKSASIGLRELGYAVITAADGIAALAVLEGEHARIDLVVLDLTMPGLSGREVLVRIMKRWPTMRVVVASGHSADANAEDLIEMGAKAFLPKPYDQAALAEMARSVLD